MLQAFLIPSDMANPEGCCSKYHLSNITQQKTHRSRQLSELSVALEYSSEPIKSFNYHILNKSNEPKLNRDKKSIHVLQFSVLMELFHLSDL